MNRLNTTSGGGKMGADTLLQIEDLVKHFPITRGIVRRRQIGVVRAVDGVSLQIPRGETLGLVGESGCGKSTIARMILRLEEPTAGKIVFEEQDVLALPIDRMHELRRNLQIIFQDPYASLNPRMSVGEIVGEPLEIHGLARGRKKDDWVRELLKAVELDSVHSTRYPHELSGGQRQRVGIARALALSPKLIICDEPVSALDVSIQAQVINLLQDLQQEFGLTYLFISHDLSVVKHISDRVAVMYLGRIVELASKDELYKRPQHPYTEALISAIPIPDPTFQRKRVALEGEVPSPIDSPKGCKFHPRCHYMQDICKYEEPSLINLGHDHYCACHVREELSAGLATM
jgi:oligopeptide transport system ATP-binding protein